MASPVAGPEGSPVRAAADVGLAPGVGGSENVDGAAPVGVSDAAVVALADASGVGTGLVPPGVGASVVRRGASVVRRGRSGGGRRRLVGVGVSVGACAATGTGRTNNNEH